MVARTRVAILSPQEVVALGLGALLGRHPDRVEVVTLDAERGDAPDVVLYDVAGLVEGDGEDLARLVRDTTSAVLALGREWRPDLAGRATALGADGVVSIGVDDSELVLAVESASAGWVSGSPEASAPVAGAPARTTASSSSPRLGAEAGLTEREVDVLRMVTVGRSNQEIAEISFLSINSIKTYIRSAYRRIGVTTRSQAVVWCLQHGFPARTDDQEPPA